MSIMRLVEYMFWGRISEYLDRRQIESLQKKRLKKLLKHVLRQSRFYQRYYHKHGITIDKVDYLSLRDIPPIDKQIVMENFNELICDPTIKRYDVERFINDPNTIGKRYRGRYMIMHTSGSSGSIGIFIYGPNDWDLARALVATRVLGIRIRPFRIKYAYIVKTGGHYAGATMAQDTPRPFFNPLALPIDESLDNISQNINNFQPKLLVGYASGLHMLAQQQIEGNIHIRPKRIVSGAEPLTTERREAIVSAFGKEPINLYGACESPALGASCNSHHGLHLFDDWNCIEITDKNGESATSGSSGKLILTNLYNYTQPLIRYQMSDEITLADGMCPCGWPFMLIKDVAGRAEEVLWFNRPNGTKECIHPSTIADFFIPGLKKLQLVHVATNRLLMRVVLDGNKQDAERYIRKKLNGILQAKQLHGLVTIRTQVVEEIQNDSKSGKYRLIVPLSEHAGIR